MQCGAAAGTTVGEDQKKITEHIRPLVQNYLLKDKDKKEFPSFECVEAMTQVVAGTMHFLKVVAKLRPYCFLES